MIPLLQAECLALFAAKLSFKDERDARTDGDDLTAEEKAVLAAAKKHFGRKKFTLQQITDWLRTATDHKEADRAKVLLGFRYALAQWFLKTLKPDEVARLQSDIDMDEDHDSDLDPEDHILYIVMWIERHETKH